MPNCIRAFCAGVVLIAAGGALPTVAAAQTGCAVRSMPPTLATAWPARAAEMKRLAEWRNAYGGTPWRMQPWGIEVCGRYQPNVFKRPRPIMIEKIWRDYAAQIADAAQKHAVPVELVVTIILEESGGNPVLFKLEPGYVSDSRTPHRIAIGLGGMLLSTARIMAGNPGVSRQWVQNPNNAIDLIGVYLTRQYKETGFDPPKVAAAYNAGGLYADPSPGNPWKLRNYPLGKSVFIDNFVATFNNSMRFFANRADRPAQSFNAVMR
ncbi:MAG: transglycosylase SLT domain-containing protein [Alphaproteobacteria bacterium]